MSSPTPTRPTRPSSAGGDGVPAPTGSALPTGPAPYHHFLRTPRTRWWRPALAIVLVLIAYGVVNIVLGGMIFLLSSTFGLDLVPTDTSTVILTPALFLVQNIALGLMIPISLGLQRLLFGQPARFLHSIHGRFRWGLALRVAAVLTPIWVVYAIVLYLIDPRAIGVGPEPATVATTVVLLLVTVLTTPLQSAGEEYATRGLLARSFASFTGHRGAAFVLALVPPSVLFAWAHGSSDWTLIAYYLVLSTAFTLITWRTGGIEAAVVLHAVNNSITFMVASFLTGEFVLDRSAGSGGAIILIPIVLVSLTTAGVWLWARRKGLPLTADPAAGTEPSRTPRSAG
ncbi:CPBP family intramembrane glutamic endopeptidase [Desertihabitans aurantiacus]|uniref:CPBP family intramembrane glutamic endopeptidase n=1 Tax=Desertihabitans aurantiacus TaxID=2282477 RepID=UPI000DF7D09B|nr:type II CAAX endopeptidase family protein [Desertihabitans aurantiacus]